MVYGDMMPILVENGGSVNVADKHEGLTPLHIASYRGEFTIVEYLLKRKANILAVSKKFVTPLHFAAFCGCANVVKMFLRKCNFNHKIINKKDIFGNTILHCAAVSGNSRLVKYLIQRGADVEARNKFTHSALHLAKRKTVIEILMNAQDYNSR
ncbi:hypothetical protein L9F63_021940 [Diploptera punctata]|uniref:Ankyrin repeat protein n=1 Tax=Diploptera punctata TaxID=6984 RepID=A0AAD7ZN05_DIPPU|nr:hypothetical protein L9F63_021940 [Diploptera punctata]